MGMRKKLYLSVLSICTAAALTACGSFSDGQNASVSSASRPELTVYCPHPLSFIQPVISEFEHQTGIQVTVVTGGTGELLARVEQEQDAPVGDIFWGGSLSTTKPKLELFADYQSSNEAYTAQEFKNSEGMLTRFTDVPSVLMVNLDLIGDIRLEGYGDLLQPELKGKIAMCSPTTSSSAYEHLINMLYAMGDGEPENGWDYVAAFCENLDGQLLDGSAAVYQGVADGLYVVGLTFEEGGANYISAGENIGLVYMKEGVISKPDVVCIIKNAPHTENAEKFVDFVTSRDTQTLIAYRLNRRSVRTDVAAPDYLKPKDQILLIYDDEETVNSNKTEWLARFSRLFDAAAGEEGRT